MCVCRFAVTKLSPCVGKSLSRSLDPELVRALGRSSSATTELPVTTPDALQDHTRSNTPAPAASLAHADASPPAPFPAHAQAQAHAPTAAVQADKSSNASAPAAALAHAHAPAHSQAHAHLPATASAPSAPRISLVIPSLALKNKQTILHVIATPIYASMETLNTKMCF